MNCYNLECLLVAEKGMGYKAPAPLELDEYVAGEIDLNGEDGGD